MKVLQDLGLDAFLYAPRRSRRDGGHFLFEIVFPSGKLWSIGGNILGRCEGNVAVGIPPGLIWKDSPVTGNKRVVLEGGFLEQLRKRGCTDSSRPWSFTGVLRLEPCAVGGRGSSLQWPQGNRDGFGS